MRLTLRRSSSPSAEALVEAYRDAVADLARSLREHQLTVWHLLRTNPEQNGEQRAILDQVERELRKRLARFDEVEPGRWRSYYESLEAEYQQRDAENRETR